MKPYLLAFTALVAIAATGGVTTTASAQNYPYCLQSGAYEGAIICAYSTMAQCMQTQQGIGGYCSANPDYAPSTGARRGARTAY